MIFIRRKELTKERLKHELSDIVEKEEKKRGVKGQPRHRLDENVQGYLDGLEAINNFVFYFSSTCTTIKHIYLRLGAEIIGKEHLLDIDPSNMLYGEGYYIAGIREGSHSVINYHSTYEKARKFETPIILVERRDLFDIE